MADTSTKYGYAALDRDGAVLVNTVCDTERGAKVNALVTQHGAYIQHGVRDETIDAASDRAGVKIVPVTDVWGDTKPVAENDFTPETAKIIASVVSIAGQKIAADIRALASEDK